MTEYNWIDTTSYSRSNKERKQTAWSLRLPDLYITITCGHIYSPGIFVMHCHRLGIDTLDLKLPADKVDDAKRKAINICKEVVGKLSDQLNSI